MELQRLRYFVAVADCSSFTRAAQNCYVAQPSLSQQIRKLEEELGQQLFERLGRRVQLTPAGRALYDRAAAILASVSELRGAFRDPAGLYAGEIRLGAIPTIAPYLLPGVLRRFRASCPQAQVTVHEGLTAEVVRACLTGESDLGIVATPIDDARLAVEPLYSEELLLAIPRGHALHLRRRVTLEDLSGQPFVLLNETHCLGATIVQFCDRGGCTPAVTCRSAQLLTVQELVGAGHGVSLIPEMAAKADRSKRIHYRSLAGAQPMRTVAMVRHRQRYLSPLVRDLMDLLRQQAQRRKAAA